MQLQNVYALPYSNTFIVVEQYYRDNVINIILHCYVYPANKIKYLDMQQSMYRQYYENENILT